MERYLENVGWQGSYWGDATAKATDFYFDHWHGVLSDKKEDFEFQHGKDRFYRGDCIFSEKTVLGNEDPLKGREKNWRLLRSIEKDNGLTETEIYELFQKAERFRSLFPTLANFMPLWRLGGDSSTNLNLAKGSYWGAYRDFPDLWLGDIMLWYNNPEKLEENNKGTFELFRANAENYFDKFGSWEEYIDNNYLEDFVDKDYGVVCLFRGDHCPRNGVLELSQIKGFLENGARIIEARAKRLAEKDY